MSTTRQVNPNGNDRFAQSPSNLLMDLSEAALWTPRNVLLLLGAYILIITVTLVSILEARESVKQEVRARLKALVGTTAMMISAKDLEQIRVDSDKNRKIFEKINHTFRRIKAINPDIKHISTIRPPGPAAHPENWTSIVDIYPADKDLDADGIIEKEEKGVPPGYVYPSLEPEMQAHLQEIIHGQIHVTDDFHTLEWGSYIWGGAPIIDSDIDETVAILIVSMSKDVLMAKYRNINVSIAIGFIIVMIISTLALYASFARARSLDVNRMLVKNLRSVGEQLEKTVEERTSELAETNKELSRENSERKQAEVALRDERDRAQRYLDTVEAVIVALDKNGNVTLINRKGCELLECNEQEVMGENWFTTFLRQPEGQGILESVFDKIMNGEIDTVEYYENYVVTQTTRKEILIAWHNNILTDEKGDITGTLSAGEDITERKHAEEKQAKLLQQNRELTNQLFQLQEEERRHIARELHDEFGQWLTAIHLNAQSISQLDQDGLDDIHASARIIDESAMQMHSDIRNLIHRLRPALLDELGLSDSLQELVSQWQVQHPEIKCNLECQEDLQNFSDRVNITLYRVVQESLTNVAKHSAASEVNIKLYTKTDVSVLNNQIELIIEDNGKGVRKSAARMSFGLPGMRERIIAAGGNFSFNTSKGTGTRIEAKLPLN
ncbi:PAS domain S-box protein [Kaarinaea lacus]